MSDIFISYASADRDKAKLLNDALEQRGWSVWWDRTIPAGKTFDEVIEEALDAAKCVIVLWSESSATSKWVRAEAQEGMDRNILVPVLIQNVRIPLAFRLIQAANLIDWDGSDIAPSFKQLVGDIATLLGPPPKEVEKQQQAEAETKRKAEEEKQQQADELSEQESEPDTVHKPTWLKINRNLVIASLSILVIVILSLFIWNQIEQRREAERIAQEKDPKAEEARKKQEGETGKDREAEKNNALKQLGITMVSIPSGSFRMGDIPGDGRNNEKPVHTVKLDAYAMSATEVTVGQFRKFVEEKSYLTDAESGYGGYVYTKRKTSRKSDASWKNPYMNQGDDHPVVCVSINDAVSFCNWLSDKTGKTYRLPTEAEWEYACRAGTETNYHTGNSFSHLASAGWYANNSRSKTHPVGEKTANAWGLYDLHGNVEEWCNDWYVRDYYSESPSNNPTGPTSGTNRSLRGGSWSSLANWCRSASRNTIVGNSSIQRNDIGFRVVRESGQ